MVALGGTLKTRESCLVSEVVEKSSARQVLARSRSLCMLAAHDASTLSSHHPRHVARRLLAKMLPRYRTQERVQNKLELMEKRWDRHPGIQRRLEMDEKLGQLRGGPQKPEPEKVPAR